MTKRRPLNDLGLWLLPELNRRNIPQKAFARLLHTTPQNLTDLLRGRRFHSLAHRGTEASTAIRRVGP